MIKSLSKNLNKLTFISEIGMNHNGNFDLCYELIKQSKLSGADIVKFQLGWRDKKDEINHIDDTIIKKLIKISNYFEIDIMFSIISNNALETIKKFKMKHYKIASRTLKENLKLAKNIIELNKLTYVSLGMWKGKNLPFKRKNIKYLWCQSEYPLYPWNIKQFPKKFDNKIIGYSDHSVGIDLPILAVSRGAKIIEKHFTLDKSDTTIRDHSLSADPNEFRTMVNISREIAKKIALKV